MPSIWSLLPLVHLVGLAIGLGAATVKVALLLRTRSSPQAIAAYLAVVPLITRLIIAGLILLLLSGIGWAIYGMPWTPLLIVKHVMVAAILVLGPVIDNVVEPRFARLAPKPGERGSAEFERIRGRYVALEVLATLLFWAAMMAGASL